MKFFCYLLFVNEIKHKSATDQLANFVIYQSNKNAIAAEQVWPNKSPVAQKNPKSIFPIDH